MLSVPKYYIVPALVLIVLDILWILAFMGGKYKTMVEKIQRAPMKTNLLSVAMAYGLMVVGLWVFVLPKLKSTSRAVDAIFWGGLFGLVCYGIYNLTNGAIFSQWDFHLALRDMAWGGFVYSVAALLSWSMR